MAYGFMSPQEVEKFQRMRKQECDFTSKSFTEPSGFRWRDRQGELHWPKDMETRHLFYTLRMIWNHTMPAAARLPGNLYKFGDTYTRQYMIDAIRAIVPELSNRKDMSRQWTEQLNQMIAWLSTNQIHKTNHASIKATGEVNGI